MFSPRVQNILLFVVLLAVAAQSNSSCSGFNSFDLIQTGIVSFNNLNKTQYCQQVPVNFGIPSSGFQVVSSIQSFNGNNNFMNDLDYSIHSAPKASSRNFAITFILNSQSNWTSISVSYLATSRNQLILGRFVADVEQSLGCFNQNNNAGLIIANINQIVPNWNNNWNVDKVLAFISGLKIKQSRNSEVTIGLVQINKTGALSINLNISQQVEVQFIQISYIIVLDNFPFTNAIRTNTPADYSFSILQSIQNNNFLYTNWAVQTNRLTCTFSRCSSTCVDISTCSSLSGFVYQQQCLICGANQIWNGTSCVSNCPNNKIWNGTSCQCKAGFYSYSSASNCVLIPSCPKGSTFNLLSLTCTCTQPDTYLINNICSKCPTLSQWDGYQCKCQNGYLFSGINCVSVCLSSQIWSNGKCVPQNIISCPINSTWNSMKLVCQCINQKQYIINLSCQSCGANQNWNGQACVCNSPFNMIQNECITCDRLSTFNGTDCICNRGYFGTRNSCSPCFSSCGTCSGPNFNHCLTCADVTFVFRNNSCFRQNQCPQGLYLSSNSSCTSCATYCSNCTSNTDCSQCISGFNLQSLTYAGVKASFCVQICGDGKRFQLQCDDGNTRNGDGCDSNCKVQSGWNCQGGSSVQSSNCTQSIPNRSTITLTGKALLFGKVVQGVRISYLPPQLVANDCPQCHQLLWVRVIRSDIVPAVSVQYMPKSQYQFLVQFDFRGTFSIPIFTISVQINPQFSRFFNSDDLVQIQISTIDPSLLAINDKSGALNLSDISQNSRSSNISSSLAQQIFK